MVEITNETRISALSDKELIEFIASHPEVSKREITAEVILNAPVKIIRSGDDGFALVVHPDTNSCRLKWMYLAPESRVPRKRRGRMLLRQVLGEHFFCDTSSFVWLW